jgi:uncharacterized protein YcfJ
MKESTLTGILAGAAVLTATLAVASFRILEGEVAFAEVLAVQPVVETVQKAREECPEEITAGHHGGGGRVAIGAATIKASTIKASMTVPAGASTPATDGAADAAAREQAALDQVGKCTTVYDSILETVGYDVVYRLGDQEGTVRMDHDPGESIPVKNGELVLTIGPG